MLCCCSGAARLHAVHATQRAAPTHQCNPLSCTSHALPTLLLSGISHALPCSSKGTGPARALTPNGAKTRAPAGGATKSMELGGVHPEACSHGRRGARLPSRHGSAGAARRPPPAPRRPLRWRRPAPVRSPASPLRSWPLAWALLTGNRFGCHAAPPGLPAPPGGGQEPRWVHASLAATRLRLIGAQLAPSVAFRASANPSPVLTPDYEAPFDLLRGWACLPASRGSGPPVGCPCHALAGKQWGAAAARISTGVRG